MTKTAFIVGAGGQDGKLLESSLRAKGYRLVCLERDKIRGGDLAWKLAVDITRFDEVRQLVGTCQPDEIYHLAAVHHSSQESASEDLSFFRQSYEVNFFSLLHFLESIRVGSPRTRLFYAASSHVFGAAAGEARTGLQSEETPFNPQSVYAMTKVDGLLACRQYRSRHRVYGAVGILYNHESRFREEKFLTKKVIRAVVAIKSGRQDQLELGDLNAEVDWGYAPDYVEAMQAIVSADVADDFVVATGIKHTVRDFVEIAFQEAGLDWKRYVSENPQVMGRRRPGSSGDSSKLTRVTGWRPKTTFSEMVGILLRDEMMSAPSAEGVVRG
jgi:GDPmannose 4,6-dehydratase